MNTNFTSQSLDEFLYGYRAAESNQRGDNYLMKWTTSPIEDKNLLWPSQVFLHASLGVIEDDYLSLFSSKQEIEQQNKKIEYPNFAFINPNEPSSPTDSGEAKVKANDAPSSRSSSNKSNQITYKKTDIKDSLKNLFLSCAEDGERIARIHCNRPFFKKIDCLCDRIRQDLIHHDSVIPYIRAQGITWAVKDLIFVSTRIISAWNITKAYVYDPSEGLNKVRSTLTFDFTHSFVAWQDSSFKLMASLMTSFLSLDILVHTHQNSIKRLECFNTLDDFMQNLIRKAKATETSDCNNKQWKECECENCKIVVSSKSTHNALKKLSMVCCDYGEKVAQNYKNRAFFNKIDNLCQRMRTELINKDGALINLNSQGTVWSIKELIFASTRIINAWNITKGYAFSSSEVLDNIQKGLSSDFVANFIQWQDATKTFVENLQMSFLRLDNLAQTECNSFKREGNSKIIQVFKDQLQQTRNSEVFFQKVFCRNYFPDFIAQNPGFVDLRSIIKKDVYKHLNEVVHDVRSIIYQCKEYLKKNIDPNLDRAVNEFQADLDKILSQKIFKNYNFGHIEGRPKEILFLHK